MKSCLLLTMMLCSALHAADMGALYATPQECPALQNPEIITVPQTRAYPGIEYDIRVCVKGGTWPYAFVLREGPAGMRIDMKTGVVTWTPAADGDGQHRVALVATDSMGKTAEQAFDLTVTSTGFVFVSPDGDDANPGTFAKPWKTVRHAASGPGLDDAASTVLYLRGGTYPVVKEPKPGKKDANTLYIGTKSPRRWIAWPGETPVIDLGWSAEQWQAVLDEKRAAGHAEPTTHEYGHRIILGKGTDGLCFDGLEIKNTCYYAFVMWDGQANLHWRRCRMYDLWADYRENPAFIFTYAVPRKYAGPGNERDQPWGLRPEADCYRHMVVQDCHFHDRHYWSERGTHGGAMILYTVRDSVFEDNLIEKIHRGQAFMDKDNGWSNTFRANTLRGEVMFAAQGCNDEIDFHHNLVEGRLVSGVQPGWMRNIWIHHNTIRGEVSLMGGATRPAQGLDASSGDFSGPMAEDSLRVVREFPSELKTTHFYRNVLIAGSKPEDSENADVVMKLHDKASFAKAWRYVRWDDNVVDADARVRILWGRNFLAFSELKRAGVGVNDISAQVHLDEMGQVGPGTAWALTHGWTASTAGMVTPR